MDILGIGECMIELDTDDAIRDASVFTRQVGGDVYNTLVAASRLGSQAGFFTRIAGDGFGQVIWEHFKENNINTRYVQRTTEGVNGLYFAALLDDGSHEFIYYRKNSVASQMTPEMLHPKAIRESRIVYATGVTQAISPTARKTVLRAFQMAKENGVLVAYDPNYRPSLWRHKDEALETVLEVLPYIDVFLPTQGDLDALFNFSDISHMVDYLSLKGISVIALKQGANGVTLILKQQQEHIPAYTADIIKDTIGAGDAFNGGFLHSLLQERSLIDCARIGSLVAAFSLRERGPIRGLPYWSEVEQALDNYADLGLKA